MNEEYKYIWTKCFFIGDPPKEYTDWLDFCNAPIKTGVTIRRSEKELETPGDTK